MLSYRVPFDLSLSLIWAFWNTNICWRSLSLVCFAVRSHNQISGCAPISCSTSRNKDVSTSKKTQSVILLWCCADKDETIYTDWEWVCLCFLSEMTEITNIIQLLLVLLLSWTFWWLMYNNFHCDSRGWQSLVYLCKHSCIGRCVCLWFSSPYWLCCQSVWAMPY